MTFKMYSKQILLTNLTMHFKCELQVKMIYIFTLTASETRLHFSLNNLSCLLAEHPDFDQEFVQVSEP
jgi:hypothetical protein